MLSWVYIWAAWVNGYGRRRGLTLIKGEQQVTAQGINLIFFLPIALLAIIMYTKKKFIDWKTAMFSIFLGIIGGILGAYLSNLFDGAILGKLFGALLFIMGIQQIFYKKKEEKID
jgi:uncharacterized membrane protein YfcA